MKEQADLFYPAAPGFKEKTTSRDAARAITGDAMLLREQVFAAIARAGGLVRRQPAGAGARDCGEDLLAKQHGVAGDGARGIT